MATIVTKQRKVPAEIDKRNLLFFIISELEVVIKSKKENLWSTYLIYQKTSDLKN